MRMGIRAPRLLADCTKSLFHQVSGDEPTVLSQISKNGAQRGSVGPSLRQELIFSNSCGSEKDTLPPLVGSRGSGCQNHENTAGRNWSRWAPIGGYQGEETLARKIRFVQ